MLIPVFQIVWIAPFVQQFQTQSHIDINVCIKSSIIGPVFTYHN